MPRLEQELKDSGKFKDFYQFTFNFAKNPGQKGLGKKSDNNNNNFLNSITELQTVGIKWFFLSVCRLGDGCSLLEPGSLRTI